MSTTHTRTETASKYCSRCGTELPKTARYCRSCGAATADPIQRTSQAAVASPQVRPAPPSRSERPVTDRRLRRKGFGPHWAGYSFGMCMLIVLFKALEMPFLSRGLREMDMAVPALLGAICGLVWLLFPGDKLQSCAQCGSEALAARSLSRKKKCRDCGAVERPTIG